MSKIRKPSVQMHRLTDVVVSEVPGFELVRKVSTRNPRRAAVSEQASSLVPRLATALSQPGVERDAVFKGRSRHVYAYSVDPTDTSRIVRVGVDGRRVVGRLVGDRFRPSRAK